jgi:hypothetical protein
MTTLLHVSQTFVDALSHVAAHQRAYLAAPKRLYSSSQYEQAAKCLALVGAYVGLTRYMYSSDAHWLNTYRAALDACDCAMFLTFPGYVVGLGGYTEYEYLKWIQRPCYYLDPCLPVVAPILDMKKRDGDNWTKYATVILANGK